MYNLCFEVTFIIFILRWPICQTEEPKLQQLLRPREPGTGGMGKTWIQVQSSCTWKIIPVRKWLLQPPFISHGFRPCARGPTTRSLGDLQSPWLLITYKSWDDPPRNGSDWPPLQLPVYCGLNEGWEDTGWDPQSSKVMYKYPVGNYFWEWGFISSKHILLHGGFSWWWILR